jgi:phospholipase D1/2
VLSWAKAFADNRWSLIVTPAAYVVAGLVFFPLTVLIAVTALIFEPMVALLLAFVGTMANAIVTYAVGAKLLRGTAREAIGPAVSKLEAALDNRGIIAVAVIRTLPIAPFTVVNLAAGLLGVRLRDYIVGTALGVAPGITALTLFGSQLQDVFRDPSLSSVLTLAGILLGWIGLSLLLQRAVASRSLRKLRH